MSQPDFKPAARIVDPKAQPLDGTPVIARWCPCCNRRNVPLTRHHVVPKGQRGDDVPENLVWVCGDGTRGCHGVLTHRNRDGETGLTFAEVAAELVVYVRALDLVLKYVEGKTYAGWLADYYGDAEQAAA